jgi:two-component system KDP operon response regulator KdpE
VIDKPVYTTGDLTIDLVRRRVTLRGEELKLTPKEYDILRHLVIHAGKVLTHSYLLTQIWGPGSEDKTPYLRVHVGTLRGKIERNVAEPRYILTEPGVGYRLRNADERVQESGDRSRISRNSKRP